MARYIFVTGGVVSSLGKGLLSASLGALLQARGYKVRLRKLDPYLNVDPGTMSPYQHGEVFVTDDGAETDLDIGHYERFLDVHLQGTANVTTGQIYSNVIAKERRAVFSRNAACTVVSDWGGSSGSSSRRGTRTKRRRCARGCGTVRNGVSMCSCS